jgi:hypothetical protein
MPRRAWRLVTLLLAALSTALSFCHLMEMPVRLAWAPALWIATTVEGGLYRHFGGIGAVIDVGTLLAALVLTYLVRHRRPAFALTLAGTLLYLAAHAARWLQVFPANTVLATWTPGPIPTDFAAVRDQWEHTHAVIAVLKLLGLAALQASIVVETPSD